MLKRQQLIGANFCFQHYPFSFVARQLHLMGFRRIELWGIAPHLDLFHDTKARLSQLKVILERWQLDVHCFTPEQILYPINIATSDRLWREASIERFCRAADIATELGAKYLFLTAGRGFENEPAERAFAHAVQSIIRIGTYAQNLGLSCLLEPLQRSESNIVNDLAGLTRLWQEVGSETVDIVLDLVAMATAGDNVEDYCTQFGDSLAHLHIVDGTPSGHMAWGDGHLPLGSWLERLATAGFRGTMTFEPFGDGHYALNPVKVWRRSLAAIDPYLD